MGANNTRAVMSQNIVALCDVDMALLDARLARWAQEAAPARAGRSAARARGRRSPGWTAWQDWGTSKAQADANARVARRGRRRQPAEVRRLRRRGSASTPTTARCCEQQKDIDAVIIATPDHMHAVDRLGGDGPRQARLRAEADGVVCVRGAPPGQARRRDEGAGAVRQPAALGRREPPRRGLHHVGRDRRRDAGPRLDQPADLAAGHPAAGAAHARSRAPGASASSR